MYAGTKRAGTLRLLVPNLRRFIRRISEYSWSQAISEKQAISVFRFGLATLCVRVQRIWIRRGTLRGRAGWRQCMQNQKVAVEVSRKK